MLNKTLGAVVVAALFMPAMAAANGDKKPHHGTHGKTDSRIIVSCFRGPWKEVIWDRPNAVFIDSLVSVGYDFPTAHAIGQRICRDDKLVGDPAALKSTMRSIWRNGRN